MTDKKTIILMSKLASYDKYQAPKDRKKAEFFRHDYVYRQNMSARFFTLLGSLIVVLFYFMNRIYVDNLDILDITGAVMIDLIKCGIFVVVVQVLYSMIGFFIFSREYNEAQERIQEYFEDINRLSRRKQILERRMERNMGVKEGPKGRYEPHIGEYTED